MRDPNTVYLVELSEGKPCSCTGNSTENMKLLLGLEVMVVPDVMIVDMDYESIQEAWHVNMEFEDDEPDYQLFEVSEAEADRLWAHRFEFSDQDEIDLALCEKAGYNAYDDGLRITDNPYDEVDEECSHEHWRIGWETAYERALGKEYYAEEEYLQEVADDAASTATLLRWFHEEQHEG